VTRQRFDVARAFPQELELRITGDDVLRMVPHASPEEEAPIPDLGELFVGAVQAGLFCGPAAPPWTSAATVLANAAQPDQRSARWVLRLAGVDPGALRIMWNVLSARALEDVALVTLHPPEEPTQPRERLDPARLAYPALPERLPFTLDVEPPVLSTRDRWVQVVFQRPPPDKVVDEALGALRLWMELLLLGGYPEDGVEPVDSGVFPDEPFQLDEATVQLSFPELFSADEAAFHAVVHQALALHTRACAVEAVVVR
jgi:hypothetical protein